MTWFLIYVGLGAWLLLVAYANCHHYPSGCHEPNDYGERHRTS